MIDAVSDYICAYLGIFVILHFIKKGTWICPRPILHLGKALRLVITLKINGNTKLLGKYTSALYSDKAF